MDDLTLRRAIDTLERLIAKYNYILNGPKHKGRYPNRTLPLFH